MAAPGTGLHRHYKIKHSSGRVLGPLDLARVKSLILKNQIRGSESARVYPDGEWVELSLIPEVAELLLSHAAGNLTEDPPPEDAISNETVVLLSSPQSEARSPLWGSSRQVAPAGAATTTVDPGPNPIPEKSSEPTAGDDVTVIRTRVVPKALAIGEEDRTVMTQVVPRAAHHHLDAVAGQRDLNDSHRLSREETVMLVRPGEDEADLPLQREDTEGNGAKVYGTVRKDAFSSKNKKKASPLRMVAVVAVVLAFGLELFIPDEDQKKKQSAQFVAFKPVLPASTEAKSNPQESGKLYQSAMPYFLKDTIPGYIEASKRLRKAIELDSNNAKALAILASCYLNLIDASNKDESYFSVITRIIELARAKAQNIPEVVAADVEFYITINKPEAAHNRIVEYTKLHPNFDYSLFYYLAYSFSARGDYSSAAKFLTSIPDNKVFSAKIFYLRGVIAEKLGDTESAIREFDKALIMEKEHARSRLRLSEIAHRKGEITAAAPHIQALLKNKKAIPPKEMALAYFLSSRLNQAYQKYKNALDDIEHATKLDRDNHEYLVEFFMLKTKTGGDVQAVQGAARMYFFLGEAEKLIKQGQYQEALFKLMEARQAKPDSYLPSLKMGDMFIYLNDVANARESYKKATELAPEREISVWSKYIKALILSYEWEEARAAVDRFRALPVGQSAIDKAAGDVLARQGQHVEAQVYYRKAMGREAIDSDVYISYADSLMATQRFKEAPFFYTLALRFDPLNTEAMIGIAKAVANSEGIDRGITQLQDELQKADYPRAEILAAIAELEIQRGSWDAAQSFVDQAIQANPDFAYSYKLQGKIWLSREGQEKQALDRALEAFKKFSDRNRSDPSGYLERYALFVRKGQFEQANEELSQVYSIFPRYPNLHYYKGMLYSNMGNFRVAVDEFRKELKNNPRSVPTIVELGKAILDANQGQLSVAVVQEAASLFTMAMQYSPGLSEPKHWAGYAAYLQKNYAAAVALLKSAALIDTGNPEIFKKLGQAYREMGDAVGARNSFKRYLDLRPDAPDRAQIQRFL